MTKKTVLLTALALTIGAANLFARDDLALMKVEAGARPFGMGGAFVAVAGDPSSGFYNPAGVAGTQKSSFSFGHNTHWENIRIETGYFAGHLTEHTWVHSSIRFGSVDNIESRTQATTEPDATFSAYEVSFKSGLAHQFNERLAIGFALGWFIQKIDIQRGSTFNVDLGAQYQATPKLRVGGSVTNLGSDFSLGISGQPGTEDISIPTTYRFGASYAHNLGIGAADIVIIDDKSHLHLGVEGELHESVLLRSGYMLNYESKNFTAGISFLRRGFNIDYAFVPYSNSLGTSHLFNLTFTL